MHSCKGGRGFKIQECGMQVDDTAIRRSPMHIRPISSLALTHDTSRNQVTVSIPYILQWPNYEPAYAFPLLEGHLLCLNFNFHLNINVFLIQLRSPITALIWHIGSLVHLSLLRTSAKFNFISWFTLFPLPFYLFIFLFFCLRARKWHVPHV